jgi:GNAT superfamily N-acetyltransferase
MLVPFESQSVQPEARWALRIDVRRATAADAQALAKIGRTSFVAAFASDPRNKPEDLNAHLLETFSELAIAHELADPNVVYLIAELDQVALGYAKLKSGSSEPSVVARNPIELCRLYAHSEWVGRGVGPALIKSCLEHARGRAHDVLWLGVWEFNPRAQRFYAKWGFERVGEHVFFMGSEPQTDWVLRRAL